MRMGHGRLSEPEGIVIFLAPATVLESLVSRAAGQTESEVVVLVVRADKADASGNSGLTVAPATATDAAVGASDQIEAPLKHISAHVINPELIRLFLSNRMRLSSRIIFRPTHSIQIIAPRISIFL